jgi:hypothetical protein
MDRKILVHTAKSCNKMIFKGTNGPFGGIASVNPWWDQLEIDIVGVHEFLQQGGTFIVESLETGL